MVCAARGYELILTMPEGMSRERAKLLRAYGAEVRETPSLGGMNEAVDAGRRDPRAAQGLHAAAVLQPRQSRGPPARRRPRRSGATPTARSAPSSPASAPAARSPASARMLRERSPETLIVAVEPASSPVLSGGAPGPAQNPGDRRRLRARGARPLGDRRDDRRLRRGRAGDGAPRRPREGVLAGISAGANIWAALEVAARPELAGKRVVTIVCDSGERYMSLPFFAP